MWTTKPWIATAVTLENCADKLLLETTRPHWQRGLCQCVGDSDVRRQSSAIL